MKSYIIHTFQKAKHASKTTLWARTTADLMSPAKYLPQLRKMGEKRTVLVQTMLAADNDILAFSAESR